MNREILFIDGEQHNTSFYRDLTLITEFKLPIEGETNCFTLPGRRFIIIGLVGPIKSFIFDAKTLQLQEIPLGQHINSDYIVIKEPPNKDGHFLIKAYEQRSKFIYIDKNNNITIKGTYEWHQNFTFDDYSNLYESKLIRTHKDTDKLLIKNIEEKEFKIVVEDNDINVPYHISTLYNGEKIFSYDDINYNMIVIEGKNKYEVKKEYYLIQAPERFYFLYKPEIEYVGEEAKYYLNTLELDGKMTVNNLYKSKYALQILDGTNYGVYFIEETPFIHRHYYLDLVNDKIYELPNNKGRGVISDDLYKERMIERIQEIPIYKPLLSIIEEYL